MRPPPENLDELLINVLAEGRRVRIEPDDVAGTGALRVELDDRNAGRNSRQSVLANVSVAEGLLEGLRRAWVQREQLLEGPRGGGE